MASDTTNDVMTTNVNETARSGKTETLNEVLVRMGWLQPEKEKTQEEVLVAILTCIQCQHSKSYILMTEHWDWFVVLQCLQDHGLFKSNPKRPPLGAFVLWLQEHHIPQYKAHASVYEMSLASRRLRSARYPWTGVAWEACVLARWRVLYKQLDKMLHEMISCA